MINKSIWAAGIALSSATLLMADFQYQETTKITGGMAVSAMKTIGMFSKQARQATEPIVSNVYVKGNRMAHINAHNGSITDLDKENITTIDFDKKTYSVMTFEQMRQAMQEAMQQAKAQQGKRGAPETATADMKFKVNVNPTGQSKPVSGLDAKEFILNMMMEATDKQSGQSGSFGITNDMWMAPDIPGYQEVREFQKKMAAKMAGALLGTGFNPGAFMTPEMGKGMEELIKEMSKLKGIPVLQVMRMGMSADGKPLPAASQTPDQPGPNLKEAAGRGAGEAAASSAESRLGRLGGIGGGLAGGLGGFGRRKKQQEEPPPQEKQKAAAEAPAAAVLMESTTELTSFSSAGVDSAKLDPPAGFKQVEPEMGRRGRK